ncbi:testis-expressed protein 9 [Cynoglossus semilaevis]|uniref:Testis expressed 9 n=1 Tax=Cynoglossus semilaevis TaxID=244447 RepID=A0A3P8WS79_CYNSE|nr:testis-expressed protein 9-like [Cynoglossus semilaevis]
MAEMSLAKKTSSYVSLKRPTSSSKAEKSKMDQIKPKVKSASAFKKIDSDNLFAKEEEYKIMNAELEAKTAEIVKEAEKLLREQNEALSKPMSTLLLSEFGDEGDSRTIKSDQCIGRGPALKMMTKKRITSPSRNMCPRTLRKETHCEPQSTKVLGAEELAAVDDSTDLFVAKTIRDIEEKMNSCDTQENTVDDQDLSNEAENVGSGVASAQIRVLRAKVRILQEELDQLSGEFYKKDDENAKLLGKVKELEEDRARLKKTTNIQQTQIEKHRALAEASTKKCEGLQLQVSALNKEVENLNRSNKQAAAAHSAVEVRLNRALEEVAKTKTQLSKMKQMNKDKESEEHRSKEHLLAENRMLKKQKAELIVGFKKQLKLIDILKRQKMHFEAAKLLSFTEEEFMKALDWGRS